MLYVYINFAIQTFVQMLLSTAPAEWCFPFLIVVAKYLILWHMRTETASGQRLYLRSPFFAVTTSVLTNYLQLSSRDEWGGELWDGASMCSCNHNAWGLQANKQFVHFLLEVFKTESFV